MKFINSTIQFDQKAFGESGSFKGYAAIFGNVDLGGDVIDKGAFKEIVTGRDGRVKILNQHNMRDPIGTAEVSQDDKGLSFEGQLILDAPSAKSVYALMKGGALDGMSIGYDPLPGGYEILSSGIRQLKALKLWEISPVTFGMNPMAGIDSVKAASEVKTIREFEDFLRDVGGFSQAQAKQLASGGFKALQAPRDEGTGQLAVKEVLDFIGTIKLTA